jgi:hypothetical protein
VKSLFHCYIVELHVQNKEWSEKEVGNPAKSMDDESQE